MSTRLRSQPGHQVPGGLFTGLCGLVLCALASQPATAADVSIDQLLTYDDTEVSNPAGVYKTVVRELGIIVANRPIAPAETLGLNGFDVSATSTFGFVHGKQAGNETLTDWARMSEGEESTAVRWIPGVSVRKGLPLSSEAGVSFGYLSGTRQARVGGQGRLGLVEGYRKYPDVVIGIGGTGYVGNDELEMTVADMSIAIGKSFPIGQLVKVRSGMVSPYGGATLLRIKAAPTLSEEDQELYGITAVSAKRSDADYSEGFAPAMINLGLRILAGDAQISLAGSIAPRSVVAVVDASLGYAF